MFVFVLLLALAMLAAEAVEDVIAPRDILQVSEQTPVCALIADRALDLHESPLVALLEARLSEDEQIILVERMEIDRILEEQQLQLLFSAEGGDSKVDSETYPVADDLSLGWYIGIGTEAASEGWGFAFSTMMSWRGKLRSEVAKLAETERG